MCLARLSIVALLAWVAPAWAHDPFAAGAQEQWAALLSALVLLVFWAAYTLGAWCLPPARSSVLLFQGTTLLCVLTVLGPLDSWAETSAAAHMTQHMLMMVVIAPLWVLCRPAPQLLSVGGRVLAWCWKLMLHLVRHPMATAYVHGAVIWFWHTPVFYRLALDNPWWHGLEHACFLVTAGFFWWAILSGSRRRTPWALLALLFTLMHKIGRAHV